MSTEQVIAAAREVLACKKLDSEVERAKIVNWAGGRTHTPESLRLFENYCNRIRPAWETLERALAAHDAEAPRDGESLWIWKNGDHYLVFRHLYPCFEPGGDPMVLGNPVGRAVFKLSFDRATPPTTEKAP